MTKRNGFPGTTVFLGVLGACCLVAVGDEKPVPAPGKTAETAAPAEGTEVKPKQVVLPGLVVEIEKNCVDVEASICLHEGTLELIACTKDSKEHESIVVIAAKPSHVHAALLLIGAHPGNPAMRKPVDEEGTAWIDMPPKGQAVNVSLVFNNPAGEMVEHPISDFIAPTDEDSEQTPNADNAGAPKKRKFSDTFIFAGSILRGNGTGPREYLSDQSGNVISLATFGDELLCLSGMHEQDNGALMWQINSDNLPAVGAKVTLRLRPQVKAGGDTGKPSTPPPARTD